MESWTVLSIAVAAVAFTVSIVSLVFVRSTRNHITVGGSRSCQPGDDPAKKDLDVLRLQHALWISVTGILVVFGAFVFVVFRPGDRATLGPLFGTLTAAVGTLVGLVAGHAAGSAGKDRTEERNRLAMADMNAKHDDPAKPQL